MKSFYTPNCPECMGKTDSESIQNAVNMAKKTGANKVVIPHINERTGGFEWIIDVAILLPSDIQIVLDNAYMKQATGCFDNVFRNENYYNEELRVKAEGEQRNIHINGIGNAVIDGGVHNGITEENHVRTDPNLPHVRVNNMILMHNVDNFSITGLYIKDQRWWAMHLIYCTNGLIDNITFDTNNEYPNRDGIDLRVGCHHIIVKNIFGYCGDDVVALSAFKGSATGFAVEGKSMDIHHVIVRDVIACSTQYATVGIRNSDGIRLYDITVDSITDISDGVRAKPLNQIRIGQKGFGKHNNLGDITRIFINNLHVNHGAGVMINLSLSESKISNIFCGENVRSAITTATRMEDFKPGAVMRNVTVDGIYYDYNNNTEEAIIELPMGKNYQIIDSRFAAVQVDMDEYLENVVFKNVCTNRVDNIVYSEYDGGYVIEK